MEEFSSTSKAMREYIIDPEMPFLPAFQVIQDFKNFPDFLMFPAFLALRQQNCSTAAAHFTPDVEIIHAMRAFASFANEARGRSRSASDALNYACQNWAFHLSRAPHPWDNTLRQLFKTFWNRHLLSWLERQWCLTGLPSYLVVLSEGQKLAKVCVFHRFSRPNTDPAPGTSPPDHRVTPVTSLKQKCHGLFPSPVLMSLFLKYL
jgi:hypothetical protein